MPYIDLTDGKKDTDLFQNGMKISKREYRFDRQQNLPHDPNTKTHQVPYKGTKKGL